MKNLYLKFGLFENKYLIGAFILGTLMQVTVVVVPQIAEVLEVGPGGNVDGKEVKMYIKKGDKVVLNKYAGTEIKFEGEDLIIVKQSDILAIVE